MLSDECGSTGDHQRQQPNYLSEICPTGIRARAVGLIYLLTRISAAASSFLIGYVLEIGDAKGVFALITGLMPVALAAVLRRGPRTRNLSVDDAPAAG